ncbi:MAG: tRNA preQ1(34) S-adenosylmethionine ribosyltransferase-isomerase QueA [bacterium]
MQTNNFDYILPEEYIAKNPPQIRGESNLLILDTSKKTHQFDKYYNLGKYLKGDELLILNKTKVVPARLKFLNPYGGKIEIFILENHIGYKGNRIECIFKGHIRTGEIFELSKEHSVIIEEVLPNGKCVISLLENKKFIPINSYIDVAKFLEQYGHTPLPPYMKREDQDEDKTRYQSVFAKDVGSVAAPTASLNFTDSLKDKLTNKGVDIDFLTLHCGYGTFNPVKVDNIEQHIMHKEYYEIPEELVKKIKSNYQNIVAVGTTVTRTLEHLYLKQNLMSDFSNLLVRDYQDEADIFLYPSKKFNVVSKLITNFHAPRSTPLMLTIGFINNQFAKRANISPDSGKLIQESRDYLFNGYKEAMAKGFKFLSYGDSCLII